MHRPTLVALASVLLAGAIVPARADLGAAFRAYDAKEYERAYTEFRELAELGSPLAQVNVGMMLLNGEGVKADKVAGYGWILAASDNESGMATQLAKELQGKFSAEQAAEARRHVDLYGRTAVREGLYPRVPDADAAAPLQRGESEGVHRLTFPEKAKERGTVGSIEVAAILGADGRVHDAWIMMSIPSGMFDESVLDAMRDWRFKPATVGGQPVPVAYVQHRRFGYLGEDASTRPQVQRLVRERRAEAAAGKQAVVQHQLARILMTFPDLAVDDKEIGELLSDAARKGHPQAQQYLGLCAIRGVCSMPSAAGVELLARSAQAGDSSSQLVMALLVLAEGGEGADAKAAKWLEVGTRAGHAHATKYLASILASAPSAEVRNPGRALQLIEPLAKPGRFARDPDVWQVQAAAQAGVGSHEAAVDSQRRAIQLASQAGWNTAALEERLAAYRGGSAWHGDLLSLRGLRWGPEPAGNIHETCSEVAEVGSRLSRCNRQSQK